MHWTIQSSPYLRNITCTFRFSHSLSMATAVSQSLIRFPCNFPFIHFSFLNPLHSFSLLSPAFVFQAQSLSPLSLFLFCSPVSICFRLILSALVLSFFFLSSGQAHESKRGEPASKCHAWHLSTQFTKKKKNMYTSHSSCLLVSPHPSNLLFCNSSEQIHLSNITWSCCCFKNQSGCDLAVSTR